MNFREELEARRIHLSYKIEAAILLPSAINKGDIDRYREECNKIEGLLAQSKPFQLCPKCNGQKIVQKPPHVPGDVHQWAASDATYQCDICEGKGIIQMP